MTYIINPMWFYWMQLVASAKTVFSVLFGVSVVFLIVMIGTLMSELSDYYDPEDEDTKRIIKWTKWVAFLCLLLAVILIAIPSKDTLIEMQIAKYATVENANWTIETIKSAVDYIVEAIKSMK